MKGFLLTVLISSLLVSCVEPKKNKKRGDLSDEDLEQELWQQTSSSNQSQGDTQQQNSSQENQASNDQGQSSNSNQESSSNDQSSSNSNQESSNNNQNSSNSEEQDNSSSYESWSKCYLNVNQCPGGQQYGLPLNQDFYFTDHAANDNLFTCLDMAEALVEACNEDDSTIIFAYSKFIINGYTYQMNFANNFTSYNPSSGYGDNGSTGGSSGNSGDTGSTGGSSGNTGDTGSTGGSSGNTGDTGSTGGSSGSTGSTGGSSGSTGSTGGSSGSTGSTGGSSGSTGSTGGSSGSTGSTGGSSGSTGSTGGSSGSTGSSGSSNSRWWKPGPINTWDIRLDGGYSNLKNVDVYDVDLFDVSPSVIRKLHNKGTKVICYFSAGTYEKWRPDKNKFSSSDFAKKMDWPGEWWLKIDSKFNKLKGIMINRMKLAKQKGCDAVDPDNVDAYQNNVPGISYSDQIKYNKMIAQEAHKLGLAVGLKNDLDQIRELEPYFDFAVNEQCFQYKECSKLDRFIQKGKPVFGIEYELNTSQFCSRANSKKYDFIKKRYDLKSYVDPCRD